MPFQTARTVVFKSDGLIPQIVDQMRARARSLKRKFKLSKTPKPRSIKGLERSYYRDLEPFIEYLREVVSLYVIPSLPSILKQSINLRPLQASDRMDDFADEIERAMEIARVQFYKRYTDREAEQLARRQADRVNAYNAKEIQRQFGKVLGLNPVTSEVWLPTEVKAFVKQNVSLIKTIPDQYFSRIEQSIIRNVQAGKLLSDIEDEIKLAYNVSDSRAALIARDQTGKFNGNINQLRQQDVGVSKYVWSTSLDERVRPDHAEREGKTYSWNDPPEDGHPGQPINCRCAALPVFDNQLIEE